MGWGQHRFKRLQPSWLLSLSFSFLMFGCLFQFSYFLFSLLWSPWVRDYRRFSAVNLPWNNCWRLLGSRESKQIEKSWIKSGLARRESVVYHGMVWQMPGKEPPLHYAMTGFTTEDPKVALIWWILLWTSTMFLVMYGIWDSAPISKIYSCLSDEHIPHYSH